MCQQRLIKSKGLFRHSTSVSAAHHSWNMSRWYVSLRSASSSIKLGGRLGEGDGGAFVRSWLEGSHAAERCTLVYPLAPLLLNGPLAPWQPDGVVPRLDRGLEELLDGGHRCCCLVSPACIIEIVVSQNGWMRPCSQPSEFHGLSSLVSSGEVSAGWSDRNLAPKHSVTSEWSAHS